MNVRPESEPVVLVTSFTASGRFHHILSRGFSISTLYPTIWQSCLRFFEFAVACVNAYRNMKTAYLILALLSGCLFASAFQPQPLPLAGNKLTRITHDRRTQTVPKDSAVTSPLFVAAPADAADDQSEEWTNKRLWNTATFRSMALLGALTLAGVQSPRLLPSHTTAAVHILAFATWFGSVAYTTFIAGITMFKNLPRQTFGKLQAKLFPKYFALGSTMLVLQIVTLPSLPATVKNASTKVLGLALIMTLSNQFYLEPLSTKNMVRRYELEDQSGGKDTDEYKKLKASFGKFHGMSSLTNLIAMCGGVAHAVYLASTLAV